MEEKYFPRLIDPKGVPLTILIEFLADIINDKSFNPIQLARAVSDYNINSKGKEKDVMKFRQNDTLMINSSTNYSESTWDGIFSRSVRGSDVIGSFPSSLVKLISPKRWTFSDFIRYFTPYLRRSTEKRDFILSRFLKGRYSREKTRKKSRNRRVKVYVITNKDTTLYEILQSLLKYFKSSSSVDDIDVWIEHINTDHKILSKLSAKHTYLYKQYVTQLKPKFQKRFQKILVFQPNFESFSLSSSNLALVQYALKYDLKPILIHSESAKFLLNKFLWSDIHSTLQNIQISTIYQINQKLLLPALSTELIHFWRIIKKKYTTGSELLKVGYISNIIGLFLFEFNFFTVSKLLFLYSAKCFSKILGIHHSFVQTCFYNIALIHVKCNTPSHSVKYLKKILSSHATSSSSSEKRRKEEELIFSHYILLNLLQHQKKETETEIVEIEELYHDLLGLLKSYSCQYLSSKRFLSLHGPKKLSNSVDSLLLGAGFNNFALYLFQNSNIRSREAVCLLKESLKIFRKSEEREREGEGEEWKFSYISKIYTNLGIVHEADGKRERAFNFYSKGVFIQPFSNRVNKSLINLMMFLKDGTEVDEERESGKKGKHKEKELIERVSKEIIKRKGIEREIKEVARGKDTKEGIKRAQELLKREQTLLSFVNRN